MHATATVSRVVPTGLGCSQPRRSAARLAAGMRLAPQQQQRRLAALGGELAAGQQRCCLSGAACREGWSVQHWRCSLPPDRILTSLPLDCTRLAADCCRACMAAHLLPTPALTPPLPLPQHAAAHCLLLADKSDKSGGGIRREDEPEEYWTSEAERAGKNPFQDPLAQM